VVAVAAFETDSPALKAADDRRAKRGRSYDELEDLR